MNTDAVSSERPEGETMTVTCDFAMTQGVTAVVGTHNAGGHRLPASGRRSSCQPLMNMRKKVRKTAIGIVLATEYVWNALEQPGQLQPRRHCSQHQLQRYGRGGIPTFKRDVLPWSVKRKLHARVWSEKARMDARVWTSLVVEEEGVLGLGEWDCSLLLFICIRIPDYLCRSAVDDTVGWTDRIGVAIRGAKSRDGDVGGGLYKVGIVPSKGNWVAGSDFIVGGSCGLWRLSEREYSRR